MIKGLTITPPVLGRISIGRVIQKDGKRLPAKDDQFTITSQVQNKDGWINHPLDAKLRERMTVSSDKYLYACYLMILSLIYVLNTRCSIGKLVVHYVSATVSNVNVVQVMAWKHCLARHLIVVHCRKAVLVNRMADCT